MFNVTFKGKHIPDGIAVALEHEVSLLSAASKSDLKLTHTCGGHARCGTCLVTVEAGAEKLSPIGTSEARILKVLKANPDQRLGCQAWAQSDVTCRID